LLDLHSIINYQIHKFVKSLFPLEIRHTANFAITYSDFTFNPDRKLLVKPDLNCRALLEELEYEVDGWEKDFAPTTSTASIHNEFVIEVRNLDSVG
jgi:hypothetical protein